jgi:hypothetical protein
VRLEGKEMGKWREVEERRTQFALCAKLVAVALVAAGWISLA